MAKYSIDAAERKRLIMERRRSRVTYDQIGQELGISRQRVMQIYTEALAEIPASSIAQLRAEEDGLINQAVASLLELAANADKDSDRIAAWGQVARFMERRAKLFGLDAKVEVDTGLKITYEVVGVDTKALT